MVGFFCFVFLNICIVHSDCINHKCTCWVGAVLGSEGVTHGNSPPIFNLSVSLTITSMLFFKAQQSYNVCVCKDTNIIYVIIHSLL